MPNELLNNFLVNNVDPKPNAVTQASESQARLRKVLSNKLMENEDSPSLLSGADFLFGSAMRGTKPAPFNDIDFMLVLDGSTLVAHEGGQIVGSAYGSGKSYNPLLSSKYMNDDGFISSQKILDHIRFLTDETYSRSKTRKDRQAVNVWMESYGFGIDIVPAFKINHYTSGIHYYIPFGAGSHMWQSTNPHIDLDMFEKEDVRLQGLLRPTARLMRKWNEINNSDILSGFHIDALVFDSLSGKNITKTLEVCVWECFQSFEELLGKNCPQFSGFSPHIDNKLTFENREKSKASIKKTREAIARAKFSGLLGNKKVLLDEWNKAFGKKLF